MEAGRKTVEKMLSEWTALDDEEGDDESLSQLRALTSQERDLLQRFLKALEANQERDPKYRIVREQLIDHGWRDLGCIVFSQYIDSVFWLAEQLTQGMPAEKIGIYAGAQRSGIMHSGVFTRTQRDLLKERVRKGGIRVLIGPDGCHSCHTQGSCTERCPKGIAPTLAIAGLKRTIARAAMKGEL